LQTETLRQSRIHQLDNRLANQIAAGEVVERPASVVKELLENSIDAGASRIEVDIERGGTRLIRITDNGGGIVKHDLKLALSRHATSKISCSEDLAAISSLGFRGEALASIASVARLVLTSRTADSEFAWQAIAEGRDMAVKIQPASATVGTRIEVRDLFYNTPARQKFLRAEKTEFAHIEEIFKRHALANHSIAFILKHNHKVVRRIPAINNQANLLARIEAICGKPFAENAIGFECQHELVKLKGWTGGAAYHRSESDIQYVFVNNRPVKDKMLNHAIRQAFQDRLPVGRMPTFVMFLEIDPTSIDVNVHPTKHEIRFDHQRMVHDLIVHSIVESLAEKQIPLVPVEDETIQTSTSYLKTEENFRERQRSTGVGYSQAKYSAFGDQLGIENQHSILENKLDNIFNSSPLAATNKSDSSLSQSNTNSETNEPLSDARSLANAVGDNYLLISQDNDWFIVDCRRFLVEWLTLQLAAKKKLASEPLLFPKQVAINTSWLEQLEVVELLQQFGFNFMPKDDQSVMLSKSPAWLRKQTNDSMVAIFETWAQVMSEYFQCQQQAKNSGSLEQELATSLASRTVNIVNTILSSEVITEQKLSVIKLTDSTMAKLFN
jgi:DNA mismatch repair protein MutL